MWQCAICCTFFIVTSAGILVIANSPTPILFKYLLRTSVLSEAEQKFDPPGNPGVYDRAPSILFIPHLMLPVTAVADPVENKGTGPAGQGLSGKQGYPGENTRVARESPVTTRDLARVSQTSRARRGIGQGNINLLPVAI